MSLIAIMLSKELILLQVFLDDEFLTGFSASVDEAEDVPKKYCNFWINQLVFVYVFYHLNVTQGH